MLYLLILLTIANSFLMASGQVLWKTGIMNKQIDSVGALIQACLNPFIFAGIAIYALATGLWIYILSKGELSYVYPIQSTAFIFSLLAGAFIFKESLTFSKILGTGVIILGVIILTRK